MTRLVVLMMVVTCGAAAYGGDGRLSVPDDVKRIWVGPEFWANRLADWRIAGGRIECVADQPRLRMRTLHLLTHELNDGDGSFEISVRCGLLNDDPENVSDSAACGFLFGIAPDSDYRSRALVQGASGPGAGIFFAMTGDGICSYVDHAQGRNALPEGEVPERAKHRPVDAELRLKGETTEDRRFRLTLSMSADFVGDERRPRYTGTFSTTLDEPIRGGIALVSHPGDAQEGKQGGRWWFDDLTISGDKISEHPERALGPILSTQYTVDTLAGDPALMKMTAQLMPIGESEPQSVALQVQKADGSWKTVDEAEIVVPGWTATFRDEAWDASLEDRYRVVYPAAAVGDASRLTDAAMWEGVIRKNPIDKESFVVAGFTGNHNNAHGFSRPGYDFAENIWFPHAEITQAVAYHDPDLLFFSGDQVYEGDSPTFADRNPANIKLDYMYKWYLWCWAYRDLTRGIPSIVEPDDHDVFQGNVWGEGGKKAESPRGDRYDPKPNDHDGGYVHPADFVQMVDRTQTSHLPDPYDPTPLEQGITSYYTDLVWGEIGVAILEDRKFKSGCNRPEMPPSGTGRPDHFNDPGFDLDGLDVPGLTLLGEKQLEFLNEFAEDWDEQVMKLAVSQTIFANMATHHGRGLQRLIADLDSNGWPQTGRNKAVAALRKGNIFHLAGDQHLATIVHHGIEQHGDAMWSFCVPSVANFYPRAWAPGDAGEYSNPPPEDYTGEFYDGFGHPVTVYAATNPGQSTGIEPVRLHDGMPGYGIVRMNKADKTITMECWPRSVDPSQPGARQYVGWPKTIRMEENGGR